MKLFFFQAAISVTASISTSQYNKCQLLPYHRVIWIPYFIQRGTLRALNCLHNFSMRFSAPNMCITADRRKKKKKTSLISLTSPSLLGCLPSKKHRFCNLNLSEQCPLHLNNMKNHFSDSLLSYSTGQKLRISEFWTCVQTTFEDR